MMVGPPGSALPFVAFNFSIVLNVAGVGRGAICNASFSECDGLEMTMDAKTIHEGGNNTAAIRLAGPVNFGQLTLKRGLTESFDLWSWMSAVGKDPTLRTDGTVVVNGADRTRRATFVIARCLPVKIKAPALNAKDGMVAIEELQLAYESLRLSAPGGGRV